MMMVLKEDVLLLMSLSLCREFFKLKVGKHFFFLRIARGFLFEMLGNNNNENVVASRRRMTKT